MFSDLFINEEFQEIIKQRKVYGKEQTFFEPFEVLYKWVHRDEIENFSYSWKLKDNVKAIDCIIGDKAIQLKNTKHVNEQKEIAYIQSELEKQNRKDLKPELICCGDELYADLLSKCDFNKSSVDLKPYQKEFINKHLDGILHHHLSVVNCFCRFGKSYLMKYIADIFRWKVSIITTKPTETREGYLFDPSQIYSIQELKRNHSERSSHLGLSGRSSERAPNKELKDILFIDEPQESFMTDLTETTLNLKDFTKVVFFTGTSEKLESYLIEPYYLAHYNFGDYIQNPISGFPKIHFHLGESPEPEPKMIRLIFDRDLDIKKGQQEATKKGWQFQSSQTETDIKVSEEGTYLLISQFTTGATIPQCFIVEDRNQTFTEQDIQLIFRCFNSKDKDITRHVYFRNINVYKAVLTYLYRQTGKTFVNSEIIKSFFKDIVEPADVDQCDFDRLRVQVDCKGAKMLKKAIIKFFEDRNTKKKQFQKALQNIERKTKENKIPLTKQEKIVKDHLQKAAETGEVDLNFLIFMERILAALVMTAFQEGVNFDKKNELNQDIDCVYLWNNVKDRTRIKWQFLSFKFEKGQTDEDEGDYTIDLLKEIIKTFKTIVKNRFLSNVLELIQTPLSKTKYEEMCELFMTTEIERKENAEILTPWPVAEEMIKACEQCGVLKGKMLEPCCGKGVFISQLLLRGFDVDFCDINPANVQFCEILTNCKGKVADALTLDYTPYDLVITNPPYSRDRETNTQKETIYQLFGQVALRSKASCFLVKSAFCTYTGRTKSLLNFRRDLVQHLQYKKFYSDEVFNEVQLTEVMFYVYNQEYENPEQTEFITKEGIDIKTYDKNILTQFQWIPQMAGIQTTDPRWIEKPREGYILCYTRKIKGIYIRYFPRDQVPYDINSYYLIFHEAAKGGPQEPMDLDFIIVKPGECFSRTFIGFKVKDEVQAIRLKAHIKKYESEIAKLKTTQHIQRDYFRVVPRME